MNAKSLLIIRAYMNLFICGIVYIVTIRSFAEMVITVVCASIVWFVEFRYRYNMLEKREKYLKRMGT